MKNRTRDILPMLSGAALAIVCVVLFGSATQAQVINFDVPGGSTAGVGGLSGTYVNYSGQAGCSDPGNNYWNPVKRNGATAPGLLSDGVTASAITLATSDSGAYSGLPQGAQGTPAALEDFILYANNNAVQTCTLGNVAAGAYDLYLYGKNADADRGTTFTVSSDLTPPVSLSTVNTSQRTTFTLGDDYVKFGGVRVGTGGTITFTYQRNSSATAHHNPNSEGDFNGLQLVKVNSSPSIEAQPTPVSLSAGSSTQLVAVVSGAPPLAYQWLKGTNGVYVSSIDAGDVSGSMTNILNFSAVTASDAADYRLIVTNAFGGATSQVATVTVILSPSINVQPTSMAVIAGNSAQLTANASGALPLFYQWQKGTNGVYVNSTDAGDVSGSTTNVLSFSAVTNLDAADYRLIVTNTFGGATSQVATVTVSDPSQRMGFSYSYPTNYSDWPNAYIAGNGKLGIMVFCNPLNEAVIYNDRGFNMAKTGDRSFAQVSATDLATIKSNCAAGNFSAANDLAVSSAQYHGGGEGNRHPGFEMLISIPPSGSVSNYSRTCDFRTGVITVRWSDGRGDWERKSFVSRKDGVIVQYLTAPSGGTLNCSFQLTTESGMSFPSSMIFTSLANTDYLNMRVNYPANTGSAGYEGVTRVVTSGGTRSVTGSILNVSNATSVILLTRSAKYYTNCVTQWNQQNLQTQLAAISTDYNTLLNGQIATHQAIYDRVKLDLNANTVDRAKANDDLLVMQKNSSTPVKALWERVFDAGRYYYLSSSSDQSPPDLLGMWTGDCNAGFGGFYHLDANLNLQIAGGNIGDMPEAMEGYFKINESWRADQATIALKLLGCRGMVGCGNTPGMAPGAALIANINTYYPYQYATGEEPWLLYPFWEHYLITGDTNFLQTRLYPLLKDMGHFYEDFLTLTDTNGHCIFAGSVSPENQPSNLAVSLLNNSTFDISGAKFALTVLIQTCNTLGLDQGAGQGVETWSNILNKLPPYLINSNGALQEWSWPGLNDRYNHRHSSQLVTVWPYREINPENNLALFNAAVTTLAKKDANNFNYENAGHGLLHSALIAAGLNNSQALTAKLLRLTKEDFYYNSLISSHYVNHGTFCTDTCNAMPGVMMEMLVSSRPGVLELLPALPPTLDQGAISGVKGRNRVTVQNLSWNIGSNSVTCTLKSDIDQSITLIERGGINTLSTSAMVSPSPVGQVARVIQLQAGASTSISLGLNQIAQPPTNLALNRPVTVSSTADNSPAPNAVDDDLGTRWSSAHTDNEWIYVDLGSIMNLTGVKLIWEVAYGKAYKIQVSNDAANWTDAYSTTTGDGGTDQISFTASGRYVRMLGVQRATIYGYSLWEFEVYGSALPVPSPKINLTWASDHALSLSWPTSSVAFLLESAAVLAPPVAWNPVTDSIVTLNGSNSITINPTNSSRFFRLEKQ